MRVEPKRFDWGQEAAALRDGSVDVGFVWLPNDLTGLHNDVVHTEPRVVAVPAGHRLAGRAGVSVLEVRDEPLMWTQRAPREWVDWWAVEAESFEVVVQLAEGAGACDDGGDAGLAGRPGQGDAGGEVPRSAAMAAVSAAMRRLRSLSMPLAQERAAGIGEALSRPMRVSLPGGWPGR